jgi:hypothetical protein
VEELFVLEPEEEPIEQSIEVTLLGDPESVKPSQLLRLCTVDKRVVAKALEIGGWGCHGQMPYWWTIRKPESGRRSREPVERKVEDRFAPSAGGLRSWRFDPGAGAGGSDANRLYVA